ncbi:YhcH/YjgK/YiaL family protein [Polaribacter atrinae]|uniref:YhcH/YjgK/YiaL family protein n=1 Tax=Polaribacter atrinae TaxID=1333662 RepID=A0A176T2Z1_9FLAO|nr:YhcH/YjgK/YiaL family protein [Polaribacter atrinae]OAD42252.1 hypothetical protein LPB303_15130 [Polaribacter atrinae]
MIVDKIENANLYRGMHKGVDKALNYLKNTNFAKIPIGKYEINDKSVYALVKEYETKPIDHNLLEGHLKYIDIHFMAKGTEQIGYTTLFDQKPHKIYDDLDDYALYKEPFNLQTLQKGMFIIFFPDDIHLPEISLNGTLIVKKVIVKVKM